MKNPNWFERINTNDMFKAIIFCMNIMIHVNTLQTNFFFPSLFSKKNEYTFLYFNYNRLN